MVERDACGVGFIANIKGEKSNKILNQALESLSNLDHRGAVSADGKTGDGAGILTQIPYKFFAKQLEKDGVKVPAEEDFAVGMFFFPKGKEEELKSTVKDIINQEFKFLGWREVPIKEDEIGEIAKRTQPVIFQAFISKEGKQIDNFEKQLFILRKKIEKECKDIYVPSLSSKNIVYKGLVTAPKLRDFYYDLQDEDYETAYAIFHQRYSTNTFPNWRLAHPFRVLAHNGEINTITANRNWLRAKEQDIREVWGELADYILPITRDTDSDSASLDNAVEFLIHSGKDILTAINVLVPRAWENDERLTPEERAFMSILHVYLKAGMVQLQ